MVMGNYDLSQPQNAAMDKTRGVQVESLLSQPPYKAGVGYSWRANLANGEQWYAEFPCLYTVEERLDIIQKAGAIREIEVADVMVALTEVYELFLTEQQTTSELPARIETLENGGEA